MLVSVSSIIIDQIKHYVVLLRSSIVHILRFLERAANNGWLGVCFHLSYEEKSGLDVYILLRNDNDSMWLVLVSYSGNVGRNPPCVMHTETRATAISDGKIDYISYHMFEVDN